MDDLSIRLSGDAGQGLESGGAAFALAAARTGLHVLATPDVRSRVRGGNNFFQVRLGTRKFHSHSERVHVLAVLTGDAVALHVDDLAAGGVIIAPSEITIDEGALAGRDVTLVRLPLVAIAKEHGDKLMANTGALAALASLIGFPLGALQQVITENFGRKKAAAAQANHEVAAAAYEAAVEYRPLVPFRLDLPEAPRPRLLMNGNQALALGALAGGCRFIAAYPMTPSTTIFEWLTNAPREYGVVSKHTEDEIAAVCMAIGASFSGARAMTSTSGGGFCLMVEALGLAGMVEMPLVIANVQRGGPSTGLPTRTEQSDLLFAVHAGHGEFPRVVLAPRTAEECFEVGWRAFNFADRYQCPVILLSDTLLANTLATIDSDAIDFSRVVIDRGHSGEETATGEYHRFSVNGTNVSPRVIPGTPEAVYAISSDEHDEDGHITEDAANRIHMMKKRMGKLDEARLEMRAPDLYGPADAQTTLVAWGSTYGAARDAVDALNEDGPAANLFSFADIWPLPAGEVERLLSGRRLVSVEGNFTSELAQLLRMAAGIHIEHTINRYDGRPITPEEIVVAVKERSSVAV